MNDVCGFNPTEFTTAPHQTEGWIAFRESPEKVFARLADHASLGDWIPLVQAITVSHPPPVTPGESTIGTARHISLKGGLAVVETVVYWVPPTDWRLGGLAVVERWFIGIRPPDWRQRVCHDGGQSRLTELETALENPIASHHLTEKEVFRRNPVSRSSKTIFNQRRSQNS